MSILHPLITASLLAASLATTSPACTVFVVVRDGHVLFCNNEDYTKPGYIWFSPSAKGKLGRVNFGFEDGFVQGSMNEAGLAFDGMALSKVSWEGNDEKDTPENLIEKIMNECDSVKEAIAYFHEYNCRFLSNSQIMFADASGNAALISWLDDTGLSIVGIDSDHLIGTNTRLEASRYRCSRFNRVGQLLEESDGISIDFAATILDAVHQQGTGAFTSYSNVFDLRKRKITLYNLANFDEQVEIDLANELAKISSIDDGPPTLAKTSNPIREDDGCRPRPIRALFRNSPSLAEVRRAKPRVTFAERAELASQQLERCVGTYSPLPAPNVRVRIEVAGNELIVQNPGQPDARLIPESATSFRLAPDRGQVTFLFANGKLQQSTGLILHKQIDVEAIRVEE